MGVCARRRVHRTGRYSRSIIIPANIKMGEHATLAGTRLLLVDPRGEIHEEDLLEFLEMIVEPKLWPWLLEKRAGLRGSIAQPPGLSGGRRQLL